MLLWHKTQTKRKARSEFSGNVSSSHESLMSIVSEFPRSGVLSSLPAPFQCSLNTGAVHSPGCDYIIAAKTFAHHNHFPMGRRGRIRRACGRSGVQLSVESNQWLKNWYLSFPSQVLCIIWIEQGLVGLVSGEWAITGQLYKIAMSVHCHNFVPILI